MPILSRRSAVLAMTALCGLAHRSSALAQTPAPWPIQRQPLASDLVELAYSVRQNALFIAAPDWEEAARSRVLRLDPRTLAVQAEIPLPTKGFGVALDDAADRLYLSQPFDGTIAVVDTARNELLTRIQTFDRVNLQQFYIDQGLDEAQRAPLMEAAARFGMVDDFPYRLRQLALDRRRGRLFAPGLGYGVDSRLAVIDTASATVERVIPGFGYNAVGIAVDEANGRVFVSNMQGQIMVVDAERLEIVRTLEVQADQLLNLVYDPTGDRLFGVDQGIDRDQPRDHQLGRAYQRRSVGHRVFVLDAGTGRVLADMPTEPVPLALQYDADRQRLYVTNRGGVHVEQGVGALTVYDTTAYERVHTVELAPHPNSLALSPAGDVLYVTVKNDAASKAAGQLESLCRITLR